MREAEQRAIRNGGYLRADRVVRPYKWWCKRAVGDAGPYGEEDDESRAGARLFFWTVAWQMTTLGAYGGQGEVKKMEEKIVGRCDMCGFELYRGETYYRINGEVICEDCLGEFAARLLAPFRMGGEK